LATDIAFLKELKDLESSVNGTSAEIKAVIAQIKADLKSKTLSKTEIADIKAQIATIKAEIQSEVSTATAAVSLWGFADMEASIKAEE